MTMTLNNFQYLFDFTYAGFDSFEGLPEIAEIDRQDIWEKGKLTFSEDLFIKLVVSNGMPRDKLITVRGFYDSSLTMELANKLLPIKASMVYVDCDLYMSTIPILKWVPQFLQPRTIIVFDDWNCFKASPDRGERRAWNEFLLENPRMRFEKFITTSEAQAFIYLGEKIYDHEG